MGRLNLLSSEINTTLKIRSFRENFRAFKVNSSLNDFPELKLSWNYSWDTIVRFSKCSRKACLWELQLLHFTDQEKVNAVLVFWILQKLFFPYHEFFEKLLCESSKFYDRAIALTHCAIFSHLVRNFLKSFLTDENDVSNPWNEFSACNFLKNLFLKSHYPVPLPYLAFERALQKKMSKMSRNEKKNE